MMGLVHYKKGDADEAKLRKLRRNDRELRELAINIMAHVWLDWEITLMGNGTDPCEASNVIEDVCRICGIVWPTEKEIQKRVEELKKER